MQAPSQPSIDQTPLQRLIVLPVPLPIDQQSQALFETQTMDLWILFLLPESLRHSTESQRMEFLYCLLCQHHVLTVGLVVYLDRSTRRRGCCHAVPVLRLTIPRSAHDRVVVP